MTTTRNAFTLIEVLLAVFIIGLGSIGLFALFAGVAEQQTRASELGRAVAFAQGVMGTLETRVGPIGEWEQNDGTPMADPVFGRPIARGVWYPTFSYYGADDPTLSVNPRALQSIIGGRFFVAPQNTAELFSNRAVFVSPNNYLPATGQGPNQYMWSGSGQFAGTNFSSLPHSRVALGSVEIEFWKSDSFTGNEVRAFSTSDLSLLPFVTYSELAGDWERQLPVNPDAGDPLLQFSYEERPQSDPARIVSFNLGAAVFVDPPNEWISSVRMRYSYRDDRLLALSERVRYEEDATRPSGRRATLGASMLYRLTPRGRTQYVAVVYTVTPLERDGSFVPPEHPVGSGAVASNGLFRISDNYDLGYDEERGEYYVTWTTNAETLAEGDILIVGGRLDADAMSPLNQRGADSPVRVTRVLSVGGDERAYLDDAPRAQARAMLVNLTGLDPLSRVYTLRRQVQSQDGSPWELRPVVFQTLDVQ